MQTETRKSRHSRRYWNWRTILGVILIVIALGLFAMNPLKNYLIARGSQANTVANLTREDIIANSNRDATFDLDEITTIDSMTVIADGVNPNDLPVIGGIAIPELEMNLPIHLGTANEGMYYGAGTLDPNQQMGESNYALASHHSKHPELLFAPLMNAEVGQTIYLTDLDKVYVYEIDVVEVVPPHDVSVLAQTDVPIVTLITCTYDLVNRVIVQGTLIEERPISEATQAMQEAFSIDQTIVTNE
ncbi:class A sortase [Aerococcaceae bacterium DSM 111020]|nr:class A sortase [Aerococcaceae bacterium DSM 111020]